ncbi:MAG TPA: HAMP domain-containing sensor histidine kinase [Candidatus Limnocylindria bacterium]|nr:HAMP domain-containing sensor histidine kinase [Candidatus Limnocylindria bacterium]
MTFSLRVALLTAGAVAVAAIGAALLMYVVVQTQLLTQFDNTLVDAANGVRDPRGGQGRPFFPGGPVGSLTGRGDVAAQIVNSNTGTVGRADREPVVALVTPDVVAVASGARPAYFFDTEIEDKHLRIYVAPGAQRGTAVEVWGPLDPIESALAETRVRLGLVALGGVLLAGALGTLVARTALTPVRRLTNIVEQVARTRDLSARVSTSSDDELGRLAASFNVMLGELEASLRSQRQLVADASHELRTPLTSIRTNLELLSRGHPSDPVERQQVFEDVVGQMERLTTLVSDLIDLARDEKTQLVVEDVRLDELVGDAIAEMRLRYPQVRFELSSAPSTVRGVRSRILRAVTNLLDNAGKWSPAGGLVEVTVRGAEVTVRDHGPGIAPEDEAHVFDRFWRAPTARSLPGSGLGLAIVKDVADTHGGRVTLERPAGGGAFFRLRLARS